MLFVIWTNDPERNTVGTLSWASLSWSVSEDSFISWEVDQELDNLVKRADEDDLENTEELLEKDKYPESNWSWSIFPLLTKETDSKTVSDLDTSWQEGDENKLKEELWEEDDGGIFERLFRSEDKITKVEEELEEELWEDRNEDSWDEDSKEDELIVTSWEDESSDWIKSKVVHTDGGLSKTQSSEVNTMRNASEAYMNQYSKKEVQIDIPMVQPGLQTYVGKSFQVGVYSLKLNNKEFNEALAYMSRGDIVKQLSEENVYGCFLAEIETSSKSSYNIWKQGYVCKGYLKDVSHGKTKSNTSHVKTVHKEVKTNQAPSKVETTQDTTESFLPEEPPFTWGGIISNEANISESFLPPEMPMSSHSESFLSPEPGSEEIECKF